MLKGPYISLVIGSRDSKYENNFLEIVACKSYIRQHFVNCVYFLQLKLFLRFSQISMVVAHLVVPVGWGFLPAEAGYFSHSV